MAAIARAAGLLALLLVLLPGLGAQDKKDDIKKGDEKGKKEATKPDEDKGRKKDTKKTESEEHLLKGQVITAKLARLDSNSNRDFAVAISFVDPQKVLNVEQWKREQIASIVQDGNPVSRAQRSAQYQVELIRKQATEVFSTKNVDMRTSPNCKFRTLYPPVEYDKGILKKWTQKELAALRGNSKLPGYPADFETLRVDQTLKIYLAKQANPTPPAKGKKKGDDDIEIGVERPEAVLIVIIQEVPVR